MAKLLRKGLAVKIIGMSCHVKFALILLPNIDTQQSRNFLEFGLIFLEFSPYAIKMTSAIINAIIKTKINNKMYLQDENCAVYYYL